jgi:hypothetical protein
MSDQDKIIEPSTFKTAMESGEPPASDPARQFTVVSYVAMAVAAPFIVGHLLIGSFGFPYLAQVFAGAQLPPVTTFILSIGWLAGPILMLVDVATFWLLYRLAQRWWIGLLFVPAFIYLMMMAFLGFVSYIPLFPLLKV